MKKMNILICCLMMGSILIFKTTKAQQPVNWTSKELLKPVDLADILNAGQDLPMIYCIGPAAIIPHTINIGMVNEKKNFANFKKQIEKLPKSTRIIVYCGCCPYEHCPNVRPAMELLQSLQFTNYYLLDLPTNIKTDWIAKGYPVKE